MRRSVAKDLMRIADERSFLPCHLELSEAPSLVILSEAYRCR
jgi:hypothetical protein